MISLDSNIVLIALNSVDDLHEKSIFALSTYRSNGYCICPPVYSELRAAPNWLDVRAFLNDMDVFIDWVMPQDLWEKAGMFSRIYADQRKGGKLPRRILADHLIAAHTEVYGFDIMGFDETVYKVVLEKSKLIAP
jgi:predicted nucleic acid-binding protein